MKRTIALLLMLAILLSLAACAHSDADSFEDYKAAQNEVLKEKLSTATSNAEMLIIWNAQEALRNLAYDSSKSLEENKQAVDTLVTTALQEFAYESAVIGDYAENGLFTQDFAFTLVTDADGGGYTAATKLVFDWLIGDATIKKQLNAVTMVSELFEEATLFFRADGTFALANSYTQLLVDAKATFSEASEEALKHETASGSYKIAMEADETGLYPITVTKLDGATLTFWFNPKGGKMKGQQVFENELYERTENATMPEKTIADYLTVNGYLKKTSVEGTKTDYHCLLTGAASLAGFENVKTAGDVYVESVVSFTESGKAVITNHYTPLGEQVLAALNRKNVQTVTGTYTVFREPSENGRYLIRVTLENGTVDFYLDAVTGKLYRSDLFENEEFTAFTTAELLANSGAGYLEEPWTEADGIVLTDVAYGSGERNLMDVYIPANYDPTGANGIILFIHGGSWTGGSKEECANLCKQYAKLGYFTATMSHTYAMTQYPDGSKSTLLTINEEVGMVFAKLKELSDKNGWNLQNAALSGYSSGCHIAYLYAYSDGNEADAPIPVKAVFGMVGCMDFRAEYWKNVVTDGPGVAALGLNDNRLVSTDNPYSEDEYNALMDSISPLAFAKRGDAVPSVVAYSMLDETLIDWYNGVALQEALNGYDISNELYLLPNSGHVSGNNATIAKAYNEAVQRYLKIYFGY